jgi:hypothetical protein
VDGSHSVGAVRTDDRQVCHPDPALRRLFYQACALNAALVSREPAPRRIEQAPVHLEDNFEMARQEGLEPIQWQFLERLG